MLELWSLCYFQGHGEAGQLWEEMGEMDLNCCNVLAEPDSQEVFAIAS